MFLIPLILGALALQLPFVAAALMMFYIGRSADKAIQMPMRTLGAFFIIPLSIVVFDSSDISMLAASDAILGVGLPLFAFVLSLAQTRRTTTALAISAVCLVVYGLIRSIVFATQLGSIQAEAQNQLQQLMPQFMGHEMAKEYFQWITILSPGVWTVVQVIAMFIGLIIFHKQLGMPFLWSKLSFPWQYNLILLLALPLYAFPDTHVYLITWLVSSLVLPCIQGISVLISYLSNLILNKLIRVVVLVFILMNSVSYVILTILGFADIWLNLRKLETGGSPA